MPDDSPWRRLLRGGGQRLAQLLGRDTPAPGRSRLEKMPDEVKDQIFGRALTGNPIQDAKTLKSIGQTSKTLRDFVVGENFDAGNPSASSRVAKYNYYNKELIGAVQLARELYREVIGSRYYGYLIKHAPDAVDRMEATAPILKFQPSDVKSRLVREICGLSEGVAYSAKKVKMLAALGPHLDAFNPEDQQTLVRQAVQLAKNNNGNHSTWDAITAMGGYLKERAPHELGPLGLGPLMDSRPELRQRLEDSIRSANENSAVAVGDQNSVSRPNQNKTDIAELSGTFGTIQKTPGGAPVERYGDVARGIATRYEFAEQELMKSAREMPSKPDPRRELLNSERERSGRVL
ncbi:hypothetical protein HFN63_35800 [Rhizobium leguminosarum]|uniref:hypothetical protein n=1 Tax=Rhizobium leguminosarum TaxID=384 RepID=UPI001C986664|nr:hypothetical protein [Rhizobium leguminosarum]MBY5775300.1 hypothetical protein [Rhizobium leguminosarum]